MGMVCGILTSLSARTEMGAKLKLLQEISVERPMPLQPLLSKGGRMITDQFSDITSNVTSSTVMSTENLIGLLRWKKSKNIQIKIREDSSTLTLIDCGFDNAGYYECKA